MYSYTDEERCTECGGKCCKGCSCLYSPEDFPKLNLEVLLQLYEDEKIMFSYVSSIFSEDTGWILRPQMKGVSGIETDLLKDGPCKSLGTNGCEYDYYHRPKGGKCLIPMKDRSCFATYGVKDAIKDWLPYEKLIQETLYIILSEKRQKEGKEVSFDHEQCAECGGRCCKNGGCYFSPKDFKNCSFLYLRKIMLKGFISMSFIPKEATALAEDAWVLKVRERGGAIVERGELNDGACILLESTGCTLDDDSRPYGGKALIPEGYTKGMCMSGYSTRQCAQDWLPYQDVLFKLLEEFSDMEIAFEGIL